MTLPNIWEQAKHLDYLIITIRAGFLIFDIAASGVAVPILDAGSTLKLTSGGRVVIDYCDGTTSRIKPNLSVSRKRIR